MTEVKKDDLEKVSGGVKVLNEEEQTYQLYYHGEALPMNVTVAALCTQYDGMEAKLKKALGFLYAMVAGKTLNELCAQVGQEMIQEQLDKN